MSRTKEYLEQIDWEKEYDRDYIYKLEEIEAFYQSENEKIKIIKPFNHENKRKFRKFHRTTKKILLNRSFILAKTNRAKLRNFRFIKRKYEVSRII